MHPNEFLYFVDDAHGFAFGLQDQETPETVAAVADDGT
jgi:hypothetical protein